ncbi:MAG: sugar transferase [Verrucomicrobia bacterium]|nr:sugar transferase [Verrucomicrobiota bacterium]
MWKRLFDLTAAIAALVILAPVFLIILVMVWILLGFPLIFKQTRPGLKGSPFVLYKFRTMTQERGEDGKLIPDGLRLTKFGKFLRATSLDELPELFNVLKGDMSIVGPRPLLLRYLDRYSTVQARRHEVRPGITGLAQVNGRNAINWERKFELDVWYVDHRSFVLDLKIILLTVWCAMTMKGINSPGEATNSEFHRARN